MIMRKNLFRFTVFLTISLSLSVYATPPVEGTAFVFPNIISAADDSLFEGLTDAGQAQRVMFDRRTDAFETYNAYLFDASFSDGLTVEVQVNPEFGDVDSARVVADYYANEVGRLPTVLRTGVETMWIHLGTELFGGGNNNILIHTGQAEIYEANGFLGEVLFHEATHSSLDPDYASISEWTAAQTADGGYISVYAEDNPTREDMAESFLPYFAIRYKPEVMLPEHIAMIENIMPNRIAFFDAQAFDFTPYDSEE